MCGRFNVIDSPGLRELLADLGLDLSLPQRVNVAPTEQVPLVTVEGGGSALHSARWWLTPSWAPAVDQKYSMFNARGETLSTSRAFRGPFRNQRGLVPMSGFIEWQKTGGTKIPWLISNARRALAVAALWDVWEKGEEPLLSCTIVTTAAPPAFAPWHDRMPVLLAKDERERWLDNSRALAPDDPLLRGALKEPLHLHALPAAVGNSRNKDAALMRGEGEPVVLDAQRSG